MKKIISVVLAISIVISLISSAYCHSGRLDNDGGHNNTSDGTYHYHVGRWAGWIVQSKGIIPSPETGIFEPDLIKKVEKEMYNDIENHWAKDSIESVSNLGIFNGYPDGSFKPDVKLTREQTSKILCVGLDLDLDLNTSNINTYVDVSTDRWSYNYIETTKDYIKDYGDKFKPDIAITRQDSIVAMCKIASIYSNVLSSNEAREILKGKFTDYENVSSDNLVYVALAVELGLVKGYPDGTLRPDGTFSRAEAVTMLDRMMLKE